MTNVKSHKQPPSSSLTDKSTSKCTPAAFDKTHQFIILRMTPEFRTFAGGPTLAVLVYEWEVFSNALPYRSFPEVMYDQFRAFIVGVLEFA